MTPRSCLQVAVRALSKNKLQTALTMIGLTIGVATVLITIALGSGAQAAIQDQVKAAGMNIILVSSGNHARKMEDEHGVIDDVQGGEVKDEDTQQALLDSPSPFRTVAYAPEVSSGAGLGGTSTLSRNDAVAIRGIRGVQYVSEGVHDNVNVMASGKREFTRLHGDDVSLQDIRRAWRFDRGRFYTKDEQAAGAQVAVLGSVVAEHLFGKENPVGQSIAFWDQSFKVVGVVGSGSWMLAAAPGDDQFDAVYVPYTTVHRLLKFSELSDITVTSSSAGDVTRIVKAITEVLRRSHHIMGNRRDDFTVSSQARQALSKGGMRPEVARAVVGNVGVLEKVTLEQISKTLERASKTMTALLACVAAVSLLVGGIGIMNVMLLSVTERTKEIGLRRAVGARGKDVLLQFLVEATILSAAGGAAGILMGVAGAVAISNWAPWSASVSGPSVILAFGVAASVGVFFGYYPARQAAEVTPIESIRYE